MRDLFLAPKYANVALYGVGGSGKTQVALELAHQVMVDSQFREYSIFWVSAMSAHQFDSGYAGIIEQVSTIPQRTDEEPKESVQRYLSSGAAGYWFLIIDNADSQEVLFESSGTRGIAKYLPRHRNGKTLFTSRSQELARKLSRDKGITKELGAMSLSEARSVFEISLERTDLLDDSASVTKLFNELAHLPLTMTQAAAYLNNNPITIAEYLQMLRRPEDNLVKRLSRGFGNDSGSSSAVATTWLFSFERIWSSDKVARDLLCFISCIEPKGIPRSILPLVGTDTQMENAINTLHSYGLIILRENNDLLDMHKLVHAAIRTWIMAKGNAVDVAKQAIEHLSKIFRSNEYTTRGVWADYLPHVCRALSLQAEIPLDEPFEPGFTLRFWVGRFFVADGQIKNAIKHLREALLSPDDPDLLESKHRLAVAYLDDGRGREAVDLLEHVVTIRKTLAENHPGRLSSQLQLGRAYTLTDQMNKAFPQLQTVVNVREATLTRDHPDLLTSQHQLALACLEVGRVKAAIELLEHVFEARQRLAEDNPDRLVVQRDLGAAYVADEQVNKYFPLLDRVVTIQRQILDPRHPDRLDAEQYFAVACLCIMQTKTAVDWLTYILEKRRESLIDDHPDVISTRLTLARAYYYNRQISQSVEQFELVVKSCMSTLSAGHRTTLSAQLDLGMVYVEIQQDNMAIPVLEETTAKLAAKLAGNNSDLIIGEYWLAVAYMRTGQIPMAIPLLEHVLHIRRETLPENHHQVLMSQYLLAKAYFRSKQDMRAAELLEHYLDIMKALRPKNDPMLIEPESYLA
ncbi:TPR-like protein, partial [Myriangium duriaei CBS 260.36]